MPTGWRRQTHHIGPLSVDVLSQPADGDRSGDFFELIDKRDGQVVVLLGDAPGSGPTAAAVGENLRARLRKSLIDGSTMLDAIVDLDQSVAASESPDLLASLIGIDIKPSAGRVDLVNAGHPPPLLIAGHGDPIFLDSAADPLLGVPIKRAKHQYSFTPDSTLLLYTDGLIERPPDKPFSDGLDLLLDCTNTTSRATAPAVARAVTERIGQPVDDATILSIHHGTLPYTAFDRPDTQATTF